MNNTALSTDLTPIQMTTIEDEIERDKNSFLRMGANLVRIREGKGYKLRGFKTFEEYCAQRWGISDRHGRRLITAAQTAEAVEKVVGQAPASESVARELAGVANDPIIIQKVADRLEKKKSSIGRATAELMAEVVATVTGKKPKPTSEPVRHSGNGHKAEARDAEQPAPLVSNKDLQRLLSGLRFLKKYIAAPTAQAGPEAIQTVIECLNIVDKMAEEPAPAPVKVATCNTCNKPLAPGARMCSSCGEVVR